MTNSVFSTVDRLTSRFKLVDSLINTVADRLLPQHEAKGFTCPSGQYACDVQCATDQMCNPEYTYNEVFCCQNGTNNIVSAWVGDCVCYNP